MTIIRCVLFSWSLAMVCTSLPLCLFAFSGANYAAQTTTKTRTTLLNTVDPATGGGSSDGSRVAVSVTKRIADVSPRCASDAWLDYTWNRGGGLPVVCIPSTTKEGTRTLLPLFAEEELLLDDDADTTAPTTTTIVKRYRLTELGPIWKSELVPDSHTGVVSFSSVVGSKDDAQEHNENNEASFSGTEVTWTVTFDTLARQELWQSVLESTISDAVENLSSYLAKPILFTYKTTIQVSSASNVKLEEPSAMANEWVDFIWRSGGGLPLPLPPITLNKGEKNGIGNTRLVFPPFLKERIIDVKETPGNNPDTGTTDIIYTVDNPSLFTFQAHSHLGRVRFRRSLSPSEDGNSIADSFDMIWEVSVRPYNNWQPFIKAFAETVISTLARNFKNHVEQPGEMVKVYLPQAIIGRSKGDERRPLFQVAKETWLGSMLDSSGNGNTHNDGSSDDVGNNGSSSWGIGDISE